MHLGHLSRSAIGTVIGQGLSVLGVLGSARLLGDAAFAELGFGLVTSVMAAGVASYGPALRAARAAAAGATAAWRAELWRIAIAAAALGAVASVSGRLGWLPFLHDPTHGAAFGALTVGTALQLTASHVLLGAESFTGLARIRVLGGVAAALGLLAGSALDGSRGAMLGAALGQVLTAGLMLQHAVKHAPTTAAAPDTNGGRDAWAFAAALLAAPALWVPQLLLAAGPDGAAQSARVTVLAPLLQGVLFLPGQLGQMLLAPMARARDDGAIVRTATRAAAMAAALPALLLALSAPWWSRLLGSAFTGVERVAVPLLLAAGVQGTSVAAVRSLEMRGATRVLAALNAIAAAVAIAGTLQFRASGARGYAWSLCAAFVVHALLLWGVRRRGESR